MNHYCFSCPIKQADVKLTDCAAVHQKVMQGKPQEVEEKICAVAHQAFMCPVRYAFRVGGPWHKPDQRPNWDAPREKADKLPKEIISGAIYHTLPSAQMYRRAGMWGEEGLFDEFLGSLQEGGKISPPPAPKHANVVRDGKSKPKPGLEIENVDYAKAINEEVAKLKASEKPAEKPKAKSAPATPESKKTRSTPRTTGAADVSKPKLSLAERAKLMKQRKKA